eukprot:scaffold907_cov247-Pinguiococcus_pyrenoidosus.AAC.8
MSPVFGRIASVLKNSFLLSGERHLVHWASAEQCCKLLHVPSSGPRGRRRPLDPRFDACAVRLSRTATNVFMCLGPGMLETRITSGRMSSTNPFGSARICTQAPRKAEVPRASLQRRSPPHWREDALPHSGFGAPLGVGVISGAPPAQEARCGAGRAAAHRRERCARWC